jgi:hypothetical protein
MVRKTGIPKRQLRRGTVDEHKDHPWASIKTAERIAADHLKKHPYMYLK